MSLKCVTNYTVPVALVELCSAVVADELVALLTEQLQLILLVLGAVKSFIERRYQSGDVSSQLV